MNNKTNGIYYDLMKNPSSRENLVFIHGSGCNRKFLKPQAKYFFAYNCYLIDLPDHGKSDTMDCTKAEDFAAAVATFITTLSHVTIIGHSLGGALCVAISAMQLPSVKRSIIISGGAKFDQLDPEFHGMLSKNRMNWPYILRCCGSLNSLAVWLDFLTFEPAKTILRDFEIDTRIDFEPLMANITVPTLILVGADDILTIPAYSHKMHKGIENSELKIIPKFRHMLPIADRKEVAGLIQAFLTLHP